MKIFTSDIKLWKMMIYTLIQNNQVNYKMPSLFISLEIPVHVRVYLFEKEIKM